MKSLVDLLECLLLDCGRMSAAPVSRDVLTLRARAKHEGDSFITITLPAFCRDFEKSLDLGRIAPGAFPSFRKKKGTEIPAFMQGFLRNVFGSDGVLLPEPSVLCIRLIRQICLFGKKLERPCTRARALKAEEGYKKCDDEIVDPSGPLHRWYKAVSKVLCLSLGLDEIDLLDLEPAHGPGATAESISGNQKWNFRRWHSRLCDVGITYTRFGAPAAAFDDLPIAENVGAQFGFPTLSQVIKMSKLVELGLPTFVDPEDEQPVRVVFVPKTLKTPRVIAVEPVCMQYAQQAIARRLVRHLDQCRLTSGHILFDDQVVNQDLALASSRTGRHATIDMSEASDRVSLALVSDLLESTPVFRSWVLASRSTKARTPDGTIVSLKKFASMGSALCFPVEAMVFFTIIVASRLRRAGLFPNARNVHSFGRDVYVFGDDIIVPSDEAAAICDDLESLGLRVNRHKSFWTGKFRESCGADCYDNEVVTPVYYRRDLPADRRDSSGILSAVATCNQLWSAGYTLTATAFRMAVERVLGRLPYTPSDSPAIGWHFPSKEIARRRSNRALQRSEDLCWVPVSPRVPDPLSGYGALAKCLRKIKGSTLDHSATIPVVDPDHLRSTPRRYGLALKRRWVPQLPLHKGK